jgi:hypothetical protein
MTRCGLRVAEDLRLAGVLGLALVLCGSCVPSGADKDYAGPEERSCSLLAYYSYPERTVEPAIVVKEQKKGYDVVRIVLPSAINVFGNENIRVDYYVGKGLGRRPTVLMLPISGGVDISVTGFADYFTPRGINCAIVYNRKVEIEDTNSAEQVEAYFRQTVFDNRQVLDYLVTRPEVDPNRLGCMGLSLGGIKASLLAGVDKRIKCVVLGLAGGSMADIAMNSKERRLEDYVKYLQKIGAPAEMIHSELLGKVRTDPLRLGPYVDARDTLMFIAAFDRVVPTWTGNQLRRTIGGPKTVYLLAGHYTSFLFLPYAHRESLCFVKRKFDME